MALPQQLQKICIFRALQLGDILCSIPALRNLRLTYPKAEISFIGLSSSQALIARFPEIIDRFIAFPGYPGLPEQEFSQQKFDKFCEAMKAENFDLLIQMQGNGTVVNEMLLHLQPKLLAGFSIYARERLENKLLMDYPNYGHESLRHIKLMDFLGIQIDDARMEFPLTPDDEMEFEKLNFNLMDKYICIHGGSRGKWRQWPPLHFATIADFCASKGFQIVLTGTESELEIVNEIAGLMRSEPVIAAGKTNLGSLGVLLLHSKGLIANCTGISHISAGLKVASVIISMDGEAERWGPLNQSLHTTLDWKKTPDYHLVTQAVSEMLLR
ncbi:glycosyltransferase family 9 protein [Pedobacter sp. CFBP9032]|uniref:glycosyltransferase family 9 protein n=1 Tax=Pedobacter sp. CFBP9032 TaxID=3096539 RepID=UPI002A69FF53|nr:glycosyltransferase family 9 protein [Pedobacter sp. CFBP9032]MDY0904462.1 glycosyltransferase family 9 protein [Pedobacter sp. CFBP9032]